MLNNFFWLRCDLGYGLELPSIQLLLLAICFLSSHVKCCFFSREKHLFEHFIGYKFAFSVVLKPMALEQVFSDRDSEDEVDDDIADFEDRRVCYGNCIALFIFLCKD